MKLGQSFRGPRLGTKLAMLGMALLIVPWFSYRQLIAMEELLIQGQSQNQLLLAKGISTLLNGREDLFNDLPVELEDLESLFVPPLQTPIRLDGNASDWGEDLLSEYRTFGSPNGFADGDFEILLGERDGSLYAHMRIRDQHLIRRDRDVLRLDNADHLRLNFIRNDGQDGRIALVLDAPGSLTGYEMNDEWRFAETGAPVSGIQGYVTNQSGELWVEFRFPLALLGSQAYFGITFVDVDDPEGRAIVGQTQTLPTAGKKSFNLVVLHTPEVRNIVQGLSYAGARILVIDEQKRVRAAVGAIQQSSDDNSEEQWFSEIVALFETLRPWVHAIVMGESYATDRDPDKDSKAADRAIDASLQGDPIVLRSSLNQDQEIIFAAHPIVSADAVIGSVVVEQNIDDILTFQRTAFEEVLLLSVLSLLAVFVLLIAFAGRLAWRIRNLRREASAAIDSYGRLRSSELQNEMDAGDEIGDLARTVSNMLTKLHQHNNFLASMPRTLRHEINNPLNTLSTSLQNLIEEHPGVENSKYLESAQRGVHRIGSIVQNLADAANLDESLEAEELETVDLNLLLENYVANSNLTHADCELSYRGPSRPVLAMVSDFRIEQMLDKIIDNAIDFHRRDTPIQVQLDAFRDKLQITVANRGPVLPDEVQKSAFDSMVSHRGPQNRLHFGLGLYVVRIIAEYHGGLVRAFNLVDSSGVAMMVQLPLADADGSAARSLDPIAGERVSAG